MRLLNLELLGDVVHTHIPDWCREKVRTHILAHVHTGRASSWGKVVALQRLLGSGEYHFVLMVDFDTIIMKFEHGVAEIAGDRFVFAAQFSCFQDCPSV